MDKIQQTANTFIKENGLYSPNYHSLYKTTEKLGYTVVEFSKNANDKNVSDIISNLNLNEHIEKTNGFTFANEKHRIIFVNEDLSEHEKTIILSHELGHIVCRHFDSKPILGQDVIEEHEANEFSHYLLKKKNIKSAIQKHKRLSIAILTVVVIVIISIPTMSLIKRQRSYYGEYYITDVGEHYHKKGCIFVKDKTNVKRLTKEEFESGEYEACGICLP